MNIAIDGPAGAGKSSIAKLVAKKLNYVYVDTGAMFRTMAYYFLTNGIDTTDENAVNEKCQAIDITIQYENGEQHIFLNGADVSKEIRKEEVGKNASVVAKYPKVREKLLELQRNLAAANDVIMDGRDIGTHVLPNADVKVFLTADAHVRALRRYEEFTAKGINCTLENVEREVIERDERDMNRAIAPLKQAEDAVRVDTSQMNIDEVVNCLRQLILDRI